MIIVDIIFNCVMGSINNGGCLLMISTIKKIVIHAAIAALALISVNTSDVYAAGKNAKFNVTFIYGTTINTQQVKRGKDAIVPVDTFVPGFTFAGWTDTAANIQSDKIILGMYTPTKAAVTASTTPTQNGIGGKAIKLNNNLSAPALPWWDMSLKGVPGKTCVVRWYNGHNGELWKTDVVPYGTTLDDPGNPCMQGYDFIGWEGSWENITEDRNIKAWYYHLNKVRFIDDYTGDVIDEKWVRDGEGVGEPSRPKHHGMHFDCFSRSLSNINGDTDIYLYYKED